MIKSILFSCSLLLVLAARWPLTTAPRQGIRGHTRWLSGNHMPSPGVKQAAPTGFSSTVYIFELTNLSQVIRREPAALYQSVSTRLVKKVVSDSSGYFAVRLPPGRYSLFTKKDTLFYANRFDKDNNIAPVEVLAGKMTPVDILVDYDATY